MRSTATRGMCSQRPANSPDQNRVVGEVWSAISANGSRFYNPAAPVPMVKVGNRGDRGMAHFSDMLFTVADVLQGAYNQSLSPFNHQPYPPSN